jgi:RNA polymerase sigma factor (sigma-70 family)
LAARPRRQLRLRLAGNGFTAGPHGHGSHQHPRAEPAFHRTEFHQQIERLPAIEREVVGLLWYHGLTQAEAGEVLGVSERTVKRHWLAARLKLHEALRGNMPSL